MWKSSKPDKKAKEKANRKKELRGRDKDIHLNVIGVPVTNVSVAKKLERQEKTDYHMYRISIDTSVSSRDEMERKPQIRRPQSLSRATSRPPKMARIPSAPTESSSSESLYNAPRSVSATGVVRKPEPHLEVVNPANAFRGKPVDSGKGNITTPTKKGKYHDLDVCYTEEKNPIKIVGRLKTPDDSRGKDKSTSKKRKHNKQVEFSDRNSVYGTTPEGSVTGSDEPNLPYKPSTHHVYHQDNAPNNLPHQFSPKSSIYHQPYSKSQLMPHDKREPIPPTESVTLGPKGASAPKDDPRTSPLPYPRPISPMSSIYHPKYSKSHTIPRDKETTSPTGSFTPETKREPPPEDIPGTSSVPDSRPVYPQSQNYHQPYPISHAMSPDKSEPVPPTESITPEYKRGLAPKNDPDITYSSYLLPTTSKSSTYKQPYPKLQMPYDNMKSVPSTESITPKTTRGSSPTDDTGKSPSIHPRPVSSQPSTSQQPYSKTQNMPPDNTETVSTKDINTRETNRRSTPGDDPGKTYPPYSRAISPKPSTYHQPYSKSHIMPHNHRDPVHTYSMTPDTKTGFAPLYDPGKSLPPYNSDSNDGRGNGVRHSQNSVPYSQEAVSKPQKITKPNLNSNTENLAGNTVALRTSQINSESKTGVAPKFDSRQTSSSYKPVTQTGSRDVNRSSPGPDLVPFNQKESNNTQIRQSEYARPDNEDTANNTDQEPTRYIPKQKTGSVDKYDKGRILDKELPEENNELGLKPPLSYSDKGTDTLDLSKYDTYLKPITPKNPRKVSSREQDPINETQISNGAMHKQTPTQSSKYQTTMDKECMTDRINSPNKANALRIIPKYLSKRDSKESSGSKKGLSDKISNRMKYTNTPLVTSIPKPFFRTSKSNFTADKHDASTNSLPGNKDVNNQTHQRVASYDPKTDGNTRSSFKEIAPQYSDREILPYNFSKLSPSSKGTLYPFHQDPAKNVESRSIEITHRTYPSSAETLTRDQKQPNELERHSIDERFNEARVSPNYKGIDPNYVDKTHWNDKHPEHYVQPMNKKTGHSNIQVYNPSAANGPINNSRNNVGTDYNQGNTRPSPFGEDKQVDNVTKYQYGYPTTMPDGQPINKDIGKSNIEVFNASVPMRSTENYMKNDGTDDGRINKQSRRLDEDNKLVDNGTKGQDAYPTADQYGHPKAKASLDQETTSRHTANEKERYDPEIENEKRMPTSSNGHVVDELPKKSSVDERFVENRMNKNHTGVEPNDANQQHTMDLSPSEYLRGAPMEQQSGEAPITGTNEINTIGEWSKSGSLGTDVLTFIGGVDTANPFNRKIKQDNTFNDASPDTPLEDQSPIYTSKTTKDYPSYKFTADGNYEFPTGMTTQEVVPGYDINVNKPVSNNEESKKYTVAPSHGTDIKGITKDDGNGSMKSVRSYRKLGAGAGPIMKGGWISKKSMPTVETIKEEDILEGNENEPLNNPTLDKAKVKTAGVEGPFDKRDEGQIVEKDDSQPHNIHDVLAYPTNLDTSNAFGKTTGVGGPVDKRDDGQPHSKQEVFAYPSDVDTSSAFAKTAGKPGSIDKRDDSQLNNKPDMLSYPHDVDTFNVLDKKAGKRGSIDKRDDDQLNNKPDGFSHQTDVDKPSAFGKKAGKRGSIVKRDYSQLNDIPGILAYPTDVDTSNAFVKTSSNEGKHTARKKAKDLLEDNGSKSTTEGSHQSNLVKPLRSNNEESKNNPEYDRSTLRQFSKEARLENLPPDPKAPGEGEGSPERFIVPSRSSEDKQTKPKLKTKPNKDNLTTRVNYKRQSLEEKLQDTSRLPYDSKPDQDNTNDTKLMNGVPLPSVKVKRKSKSSMPQEGSPGKLPKAEAVYLGKIPNTTLNVFYSNNSEKDMHPLVDYEHVDEQSTGLPSNSEDEENTEEKPSNEVAGEKDMYPLVDHELGDEQSTGLPSNSEDEKSTGEKSFIEVDGERDTSMYPLVEHELGDEQSTGLPSNSEDEKSTGKKSFNDAAGEKDMHPLVDNELSDKQSTAIKSNSEDEKSTEEKPFNGVTGEKDMLPLVDHELSDKQSTGLPPNSEDEESTEEKPFNDVDPKGILIFINKKSENHKSPFNDHENLSTKGLKSPSSSAIGKSDNRKSSFEDPSKASPKRPNSVSSSTSRKSDNRKSSFEDPSKASTTRPDSVSSSTSKKKARPSQDQSPVTSKPKSKKSSKGKTVVKREGSGTKIKKEYPCGCVRLTNLDRNNELKGEELISVMCRDGSDCKVRIPALQKSDKLLSMDSSRKPSIESRKSTRPTSDFPEIEVIAEGTVSDKPIKPKSPKPTMRGVDLMGTINIKSNKCNGVCHVYLQPELKKYLRKNMDVIKELLERDERKTTK